MKMVRNTAGRQATKRLGKFTNGLIYYFISSLKLLTHHKSSFLFKSELKLLVKFAQVAGACDEQRPSLVTARGESYSREVEGV